MPIYEFYCKACDVDFEVLKKIGDNIYNCELCSSLCEKLVSMPSMQPDTFWSGVDYPGLKEDKRVFTSKKDWERAMKEKGRVVYEKGMFDSIPANAEQRRDFRAKKREAKFGKEVRESIAEVVREKIN